MKMLPQTKQSLRVPVTGSLVIVWVETEVIAMLATIVLDKVAAQTCYSQTKPLILRNAATESSAEKQCSPEPHQPQGQ